MGFLSCIYLKTTDNLVTTEADKDICLAAAPAPIDEVIIVTSKSYKYYNRHL